MSKDLKKFYTILLPIIGLAVVSYLAANAQIFRISGYSSTSTSTSTPRNISTTTRLSVSLDPSTPASMTIKAGAKSQEFARIALTALEGTTTINAINVGTNIAQFTWFRNIQIYDGSTRLGSAGSLNAVDRVFGFRWATIPVSQITIANNQKKVISIKSDIVLFQNATTTIGNLKLGVVGMKFRGKEPSIVGAMPVYGYDMVVQGLMPSTATSTKRR